MEVWLYNPDGSYEHRSYDADGSEPWVAQTTIYNDQGHLMEHIHYPEEWEVPVDYIPAEIFDNPPVLV